MDRLYPHQRVGIDALTKWDDPAKGRHIGGCFWLADQMGLGKSRQVIEAAQGLYRTGEIDTIIVVCPAAVRSVWFDPELGELAKFHVEPLAVTEYHARSRMWTMHPPTNGHERLKWYITNYDFIRSEERLGRLLQLVEQSKRVMLVLDESSAVKNHKAQQAKACLRLRKSCRRVALLNGTPISHSPADLFMQSYIMDPRILGCSNYFHFLARYAVKGGFKGKQIIGWHDLDELQQKLAPYVLRREAKDCLDLPPRLPPITLSVPLSKESWKLYKQLRDEMIAWLDEQTTAVAPQAGVRAMRLAQVCSGFVGGLRVEAKCPSCNFDPMCLACQGSGVIVRELEPRATGTEKLDLLKTFARERFEENEKLLVWCRFRWEVARIVEAFDDVPMGTIWGGQLRDERDAALRLLDPRTAPEGPALVVGTPASGSMGLNLTAASTAVYVSNDYSLKTRLQSEARIDRPGQTRPTSYVDIIATGPDGQKTVDHVIVKALRQKNDLAAWTVAAWKQALTQEE